MAGLAPQRLARGVAPRHAFGKLALVNVLMATGATERVEVIERNLRADCRLVAVVAGYCLVPSGERKTRFLVHVQRVAGGLEGRSRVALLATVAPGLCRKLALVLILVAIHAEGKLDLVASLLASRNMAVGALDLGVGRDKREAGLGVIGRRISRWAPALNRVATLASAAVGALQELPLMRIGLVAIRAIDVRNRDFEIGALVAGHTRHFNVLAQQRELGLRVIEGRGEGRFLPRESAVAGVACLLEFALVRVAMASGAGGELQPCVSWQAIGAGGVAFLAGCVQVRPGKRIARLRVVEVFRIDLGGLPIDGGMTLTTVGSEAALMLVFMAGDAVGRQAEPGAIQVLCPEQSARRRRDMLGYVAGAAADADVLAVERISGLRVIEAFRCRIPVQKGEVLSVVIRVALNAGRAGRTRARESGVKPLVPLQLIRDLAMAFDTAKGRGSGGNFVTLDAIGRTIQVLVRPGKRSGGDLRMGQPKGYPDKADRKTPCKRPQQPS